MLTLPLGGIYAQRADVKASLLALNLVPVVVSTSSMISSYSTLATSLGFGTYPFFPLFFFSIKLIIINYDTPKNCRNVIYMDERVHCSILRPPGLPQEHMDGSAN